MTDQPFLDPRLRPCPFEAVARWDDDELARSTAAVRVDAIGRAPTLWFPWAEIRTDRLRAAGTEPWCGGVVERWDATTQQREGDGPVSWRPAADGRRDGVGVVRRWVAPPPGLDALAGLAVVDHDQARVEVVDAAEGDDPRDVTTKRFPYWGDAAELVDILDSGGVVRDHARPVVEASQILGQSIVRAMRHAPGRRVVSAHLVALRPADANQSIDFELDELSHGRTFSSVVVRAAQAARTCASTTLLLGVTAPDVVTHAEPSEPVAGPYESVPHDMGVTGRDLRVVDAAYTDDPAAPVGPPVIDAWVRFRAVPDDQALHAGLVAQFTGHMSIAAALRPHAGIGQIEAHRTISTAINAIGISFHAEVRADRWLRYRHLATVVRDGMAHAECRVLDDSGALVASFTVDAMLRPLDRPAPDARTAL